MDSGTSGEFNILEFPDEILIEIILHLNARDRIRLGYTCKTFTNLVFNDTRFYRNLDFSEEGCLTYLSDVRQYLKNESMRKHVRRINFGNMYYPNPVAMLTNVMLAKNLVELNMIGILFDDYSQLGWFLYPMESLKKLSVSWPDNSSRLHIELIETAFRKLEHLTVRVSDLRGLEPCVQLIMDTWQELTELRLLFVNDQDTFNTYGILTSIVDNFDLSPKLQIFACYNMNPLRAQFGEEFIQILPNNEGWTQIHMGVQVTLLYEKNLEVTQEMSDYVQMLNNPANNQDEPRNHEKLFVGDLLTYAVSTAAGNKVDFQCSCQSSLSRKMRLTVADTKLLLLQNPRHQISYVNIEHDLVSTCDMHLSQFPNLTKLVLCGIIRGKSPKQSILRILRTEGESSNLRHPDAAVESHPPFKKLVEDTPRLKDFTLYPDSRYKDIWDLTCLRLISGWKELTTLFLGRIPIVDGKFLIEIGKQCVNLQKLRLKDLGRRNNCCYKDDLSKMLTYCRNLKDFAIEQTNLGQVSDMFAMFAENSKLRRLRITSLGDNNTLDNLVSAVEGLVLSRDLILLVCEFKGQDEAVFCELNSTLKRLKDELNRPSFEFDVFGWLDHSYDSVPRNDVLKFAHKDLLLPHKVIDSLYQINC